MSFDNQDTFYKTKSNDIVSSQKEIYVNGVLQELIQPGYNLAGANLTGAYLVDADFTNVDLTNADLTNANLKGIMLQGATIVNTKMLKGQDELFSSDHYNNNVRLVNNSPAPTLEALLVPLSKVKPTLSV